MTSRIRSSVVAACAVLFATVASAQTTIQLGGKSSLTIKGFISATMFAQDQQFNFGNGQNAEYPATPQATTDRWFGGGDVRNTRLTLVFDGPKIGSDWRVGGTLEMDFFGGFNGTGTFSGQQPIPRLRLAFADITNGRTTIRIGEDWAPLFGYTAVSLSHIAFPLGYGSAGDVGWRFPGIFLTQVLTGKDSVVNVDLKLAVMQNEWPCPATNPPGTTCNTTDNTTAGNATAPQYELRLNVGGKMMEKGTWSAYGVVHYDYKDLSLANATAAHDKVNGSAYEFGTRFNFDMVMVQGNFYSGHSIGQQFGAINQQANGCPSVGVGTTCTAARQARIASQGGWGQVGLDLTPNWSLFGFVGEDNPKDNDIKALGAAARDKNIMYAGMVRWRSGPYALGLEYMNSQLTTGAAVKTVTKGTQLAFSTLFNF